MIPSADPSATQSAAGDPPRDQDRSLELGSVELPADLSDAFETRAGALRRGESSEPPETLGGCYEALRQGSLERRRVGHTDHLHESSESVSPNVEASYL